jgi:hypothetical protein
MMFDVELGKSRSADAPDMDAKRKANPTKRKPGLKFILFPPKKIDEYFC